MGGYPGGYPSLAIKPVEIQDPLQKFAQVTAIGGAAQEQQLREIQIENARAEQVSTQALQKAFMDNKGNIGAILASPPAGIIPKHLMELQREDQQQRLGAASLTEANLKNEQALDSKAGDIIQNAKTITDPTQRPQYVHAQIQGLLASTEPLQQAVGLHLAQAVKGIGDWSDDGLNTMEAHIGRREYYNNLEIEQRTKMMTATGAAQRGAAAATEAAANPNVLAAKAAAGDTASKTTLDVQAAFSAEKAAKIAGAEQPYKLAIENVRQQVSQSQQITKDARDKIETNVLKPFEEKNAEIDQLNSAIDQAQAGNVAAARAVLYKVIGVAQPQGTHRVSPSEVKGFEGMGGVGQRVAGSMANALSGDPWTPQMVEDMRAFAEGQRGAAKDTLSRGIDNVNSLYQTNVGQGLKSANAKKSKDPAGIF